MMRPLHAPPDRVNGTRVEPAEPTLRDQRPEPSGNLPRFANLWVLLALVGLVILVLAFASRPTSPRPAPTRTANARSDINADAVERYKRELEARERELAAAHRALGAQQSLGRSEEEEGEEDAPGVATETDLERLKRTSLFADSLAFSRRQGDAEPTREDREERLAKLVTDALSRPGAADEPTAPRPDVLEQRRQSSDGRDRPGHDRVSYRVPEGTVIETALMHRVDGELGGPVRCLVTAPVFAPRRDLVLIPAGAIALGSAQAVTRGDQRRLAVAFHRILLPDGTDLALERASAAGQRGDQGIASDVDNHYWSTFGAAGAVGLIAGLAQSSTQYGAVGVGAGDVYRQGVASSLAGSSMRILDRYLNRLPSITVDEATPVKVVLMRDVQIPTYEPQP